MLKPFRVYCQQANEDDDCDFYCMAEDEEHAEEQGVNAYPKSEWIEAIEIRNEEYPHKIPERLRYDAPKFCEGLGTVSEVSG